jgi:maltose alpha-D-glucosyltransferase / alpha-amylase
LCWNKPVAPVAEIDDRFVSKMKIAKYDDLFNPVNIKLLADSLIRNYLKTCRWFGGKGRQIREINVSDTFHFSYNQERFSWLIIEVIYIEGMQELYQLPIGFASGGNESILREEDVKSIIAPLTIGNTSGILYDAVYSGLFREAIFENLVKKRKLKNKIR